MRSAIIHVSIHHLNTAKISAAMAIAISAEVLSVSEAKERHESNWDAVGLGSGIFFGAHHKSLLRYAAQWMQPPKAVFVFSTAGLPSLGWLWHRSLRSILTRQRIPILNEACFPGWDTVGPLRWIGGIQRGRPNSHDMEQAAAFAQSSLAKWQQRNSSIHVT